MKIYPEGTNATTVPRSPANRDSERIKALELYLSLNVMLAFSLEDNIGGKLGPANILGDVTSQRFWRERLKDDGPLHQHKGKLDTIVFDHMHMPTVCCIFLKNIHNIIYILTIYIIYIYVYIRYMMIYMHK